jgi:hypothetical protein
MSSLDALSLEKGPPSRPDHPISWSQTLVIEGKLFALPDEAQVRTYGEVIDRVWAHPTMVLLSLMDPGWPDGILRLDHHLWPWLSYRDGCWRSTGPTISLVRSWCVRVTYFRTCPI